MKKEYSDTFNSPIGVLEVIASAKGVIMIKYGSITVPPEPNVHTTGCIEQLSEYFNGRRGQFTLDTDTNGSEFQERVWRLLSDIPYGQTITYLELARIAGKETYIRAVGRANGANPLNIVVPCHRVIGTGGKLIGYGGGLWRKEWLLKHEAGISGTVEQFSLFEGLPNNGEG